MSSLSSLFREHTSLTSLIVDLFVEMKRKHFLQSHQTEEKQGKNWQEVKSEVKSHSSEEKMRRSRDRKRNILNSFS